MKLYDPRIAIFEMMKDAPQMFYASQQVPEEYVRLESNPQLLNQVPVTPSNKQKKSRKKNNKQKDDTRDSSISTQNTSSQQQVYYADPKQNESLKQLLKTLNAHFDEEDDSWLEFPEYNLIDMLGLDQQNIINTIPQKQTFVTYTPIIPKVDTTTIKPKIKNYFNYQQNQL